MTALDFIDKTLDIKDPPDFTVVSTFAGGGGSSTGYVWAGGKVLLAVEWDDNAVETYRLNYPDTPIYHGDIVKLSVEEVLERTGLQPGELDIFDGSPPCQGFSTAGQRNFYDARNELFHEYVRLLRGLKPKTFIMENVPGLIKGKMKLVFAQIIRELKASGYRVSCRKLNAMYFGVPQSRERLIFIGVRDDLSIVPSHPAAQTRPIAASDALVGVSVDEDERQMLLSAAGKYRAYKYWGLIEPGRVLADYPGHKNGFSCRKHHPNRPAFTLPKNDGNISMHGSMHWVERRRFTVGEYKRLASFPDSYQFAGRWRDAVARIGNSVLPRFMQAIAEHVYKTILEPQRVTHE